MAEIFETPMNMSIWPTNLPPHTHTLIIVPSELDKGYH